MAAPHGAATLQKKYDEPFWSAALPDEERLHLRLDVLKNGAIVENLPIHEKPCYLIGRLPQCDIQMAHESISRQHAVIQHKGTGQSFLFDLSSTHGTFVNKKRVPPRKYVPIRQGDVLRFGESTRLFVVESPVELLEEEEARRGAAEEEDSVGEHGGAEADEEGDGEMFSGSMEDAKRYMKSFQKSSNAEMNGGKKKKKKRFQQRDVEYFRLEADDDSGSLSLNKVSKRGAGEEDDEEEVERDDDVGWNRIGGYDYFLGSDSVTGGGGEDDEYYDRTGGSGKKGRSNKQRAETVQSLRAKMSVLSMQAEKLEMKISELEAQRSADDAEADSLDAYMQSNATSMIDENIKKNKKILRQVRSEEKRLQAILSKVESALDRAAPLKKSATRTFAATGSAPSSSAGTAATDSVQSNSESTSKPVATTADDGVVVGKKRKAIADTLAELQSLRRDGEVDPSDTAERSSGKKRKKRKKVTAEDMGLDEDKYVQWEPPMGQTGDGRTHLNSKYNY